MNKTNGPFGIIVTLTFVKKKTVDKQKYLPIMKSFIASLKMLRQWSHICVRNQNCEFMRTRIPCYIGNLALYNASLILYNFLNDKPIWKYIPLPNLVWSKLFRNTFGANLLLLESDLNINFTALKYIFHVFFIRKFLNLSAIIH